MLESRWECVGYPLNVFLIWVDEMKIDQKMYKIVLDDGFKVSFIMNEKQWYP